MKKSGKIVNLSSFQKPVYMTSSEFREQFYDCATNLKKKLRRIEFENTSGIKKNRVT
jgi:hypothetical protein